MARNRRHDKRKLKEMLETLYISYNRREYVGSDPILFLYRYPDLRDREIAGLLASSLAFGNVKQIIGSVGRVLDAMGSSPRDFLFSNSMNNIKESLKGIKHRWIDSEEIARLLSGIGNTIKRYDTLEDCFESKIESSGGDINRALSGFVEEIGGGCLRKGFLPCPQRGSPCKRLNLYLRWMVRRDEVDPGGWKCVSASMLTVPLDTHMYRLSRKLGLTGRYQKDMKTAMEITESFREVSPEDPVKYDFALTRLGIINDLKMQEFEKCLEEAYC